MNEFGRPSENGATLSLLNFRLLRVMEKVRSSIGMSESDFSDVLGIKPGDYRNLLQNESELQVVHIARLSREFDLNPDLLFTGKIDYRALSAAFGTHPILPERYRNPDQQLCRVRTVQGILTYLEERSALGYPEKILSRLQTSAAVFEDPDAFTSPLFIEDFLNELRFDGFQDSDIREMGRTTFWVNRNTEIGKTLARTPGQKELYQCLYERLLGNFDQIWNYHLLSLKSDHCLFEVNPRDQSHDLFKSQVIGTRAMCLCRQGVFKSMSGFLGQGFAELTELECVYLGGQRCVYKISWENLNPKIRPLSADSQRLA